MNKLLISIAVLVSFFGSSQTVGPTPDCNASTNLCNPENGVTTFPLSIGSGAVDDLPFGNDFSNPGFGEGPAQNGSGCLNSDELNPNWFVINIGSDGFLEFTIGSAGSFGYYDWALWPYYDNNDGTSACNDIQNNTLAPVACCWNASSAGFTGLVQQGNLPAGAQAGNFDWSFPVTAGQQYVLCFSNFSNGTGNINLYFGENIPGNNNPNTAGITCEAFVPGQVVCLGEEATVNISISPNISNPTFNWLVTDGVSDVTSGVDVAVNITETTDYMVQIFENGDLIDTAHFTITVVPPPTPNAGMDDIICQGQPISLAGIPSDASNTFGWTHSTAGISPTPTVNYAPNASNASPTVTVNQPGTYSFILTEDNEVCPPVSDQVQVLVSNTTHTTTWVGPSCAGMSNGSITINNPDAVEYSFDNGITWVTTPTQSGFPVGSYPVISRNQYGCVFSSTVVITEPDQLYVFAGNDTLVCQNGTANLWAVTSAPGLPVDYIWSHTAETESMVTFSPTVNTTIEVYAMGPAGCVSDTVQIQVTVRDPLSGIINDFDTICPGYPTNVFVNSIAGGIAPYSISWSSGETGQGTFMDFEVNPSVETDYIVTITDQCESTPLVLNTQVSLYPLPEPQFSVVDATLCEPAIFELSNDTDPLMTQSYIWNITNGDTFYDTSPIFTEETSHGIYDVQLIVTSPNGCIDSITYLGYLTSYQTPVANFSWSPNPVQQYNTEVNFSNQSFLAVENSWTFEQGVPPSSNLETTSTTFPDGITGEYEVTLAVVSEQGCMDTVSRIVTVFPEVLIYAPNTFTPDGDEYNQNWSVVIDGIDFSSFELQIYNRWGEMIWESNDVSVSWDGTYNGRIAPTGTYTWIVKAKDALNDAKYIWNGYVTVLK